MRDPFLRSFRGECIIADAMEIRITFQRYWEWLADSTRHCILPAYAQVKYGVIYSNGVLAAAVDEEIVLKELKGEKTSELSFYDCLWEIEEHKDKGEDNYILRHLMSGMVLGVDTVKSDDRQIPIKPKLIDISDGKSNQNENDKLGSIELKLAKK